ncbi:MAG: hemolysin family protein [Anaerolineaceae bacterium]
MLIEILIVLLLILINGLFSMAEMAVVSARKNRLEQKAEDGNNGAARALELAENPNRFLSTVQIGITLIGILSGAFGGATIAGKIGQALSKVPWLARYSDGIGVAIVVLTITYLSLVLGELVPKQLALNNAEKVAAAIAPLMRTISRITTPLVSLLSGSTNLVLRMLQVHPSGEPDVTEDDLKSMLDQGTEEGIFEESEQDMVERIFRLSDRSISALMTPRTEIIFLDINATPEEIHQKITAHPFSRFPVIQGSTDNVIGMVEARDLLLQRVEGFHTDIRKALRQPVFIPETTAALDVLTRFKTSGSELAIVIDEYGGVLGLVSMNDILEAIVGEWVNVPEGGQEEEAIRREDGSWLFDGLILIDDLKDYLDLDELPDEEEGNYETLSGLMMTRLGKIPISGDHFEWENYHFEVVDMDGRRVDKVLVVPPK